MAGTVCLTMQPLYTYSLSLLDFIVKEHRLPNDVESLILSFTIHMQYIHTYGMSSQSQY